MEKTKFLIIGAGISGLTFANYIKDDYLIVEKEDRVGGYCKTTKRNGYVWDYAGHFFHFKTEEFRNKFLSKVNESQIVNRDKCTKIIYDYDLVDYPFQMNIHQLKKQEFIDCLYDLFNKVEKDNYDNFLDMLYGKFGKSITEKFLKPYNEKLYAIDLSKLDTNAMGRFFPYANKEQIINNMKSHHNSSYNNTFLYPRDGAGSFIEILHNDLLKNKIILNTMVTKVDLNKKVASLSNGAEVEFEYLINTSPLNEFLEKTTDKKLIKFSNKLSYNKVLVFNLGFDKKSPMIDEHWLYIPSKKCNFYRCGFYDNILGDDKLSMYIEIGYSKDSNITQEEIDNQLKLTLENLLDLGITTKDMKLIDYQSIVMDPAYVHIEEESDKEIKNVFNELSDKNVYSIGRYGAWTYCSMEDAMISAKELADKLSER